MLRVTCATVCVCVRVRDIRNRMMGLEKKSPGRLKKKSHLHVQRSVSRGEVALWWCGVLLASASPSLYTSLYHLYIS